MKFITLVVVIGILSPCLAWSDYTNQIMSTTPLDGSMFLSQLPNIFPDIISQCSPLFTSLSQNTDDQATIDYITLTQQNYIPWCQAIHDEATAARNAVEASVIQAYANFQTIGDQIEWAYTLIQQIMTSKGCTATMIEEFLQSLSMNLTMVIQTSSYGLSSYSNLQNLIPYSGFYGLYQGISTAMTAELTLQTRLQMVQDAEFIYMGETERTYTEAIEIAEWYLITIIGETIASYYQAAEDIITNAVFDASNMQCLCACV